LWPWLSLLLALSLSWPTYAEPLTKAQGEALLMILDELSTGASQTREGLAELTQGLSEIKSGLNVSKQGSEKALEASEKAETASSKALTETKSLSQDLSEQREEVSKLKQDSTELTELLKASAVSSKKIADEVVIWKWTTVGAGSVALLALFLAALR